MRKIFLSLIAAAAMIFTACDAGRGPAEVLFSYKAILNEEFRFGSGKEIPVTIESSVDRDGLLSPDGKYLVYSSDRQDGNFDLYLRQIGDIRLVRLTQHPSADISPALSPDGRTLAFVSMRDDPEGDIFVAGLDPGDAADAAAGGSNDYRLKANNLTRMTDDSERVRAVSDLNPSWSPDGKTIVFSSKRGGIHDIWAMDPDGNNSRRITRDGGMYPSFSPDGKHIVCISYRHGREGELCVVEMSSGRDEIIKAQGIIKLFPVFAGSAEEIVYTAIEGDTDGSGGIDLKDSAALWHCNIRTGENYRLTLPSASSFAARWYPAYSTERYRGVLLYSSQAGTNINISLIPETGIIPIKDSARSQYDLANKYLKEDDDAERHLAGLLRVYERFGSSRDVQSAVYSARALYAAAVFCLRHGDRPGYIGCESGLSSLSLSGNSYASVVLAFLKSGSEPAKGIALVRSGLEKLEGSEYVPYLKEDLAGLMVSAVKKSEAIHLCREIIDSHPSFERIISVRRMLAGLVENDFSGSLSPDSLEVLEKGQYYQVNEVMLKTLELAQAVRSAAARENQISGKLAVHAGNRQIQSLLFYAMGKALYDAGDLAPSFEYLAQALDATKPASLVGYLSNTLIGRIKEQGGDPDSAAVYYHNALSRYRIEWKDADFMRRLEWLVRYYEETVPGKGTPGSRSELFRKYVSLMSFIHRLGKFETIYNRHSSIAHVLYIDATIEAGGRRGIDDAEKEYRDGLAKARMDFDKAHMYGLAYVLARRAMDAESGAVSSGPAGPNTAEPTALLKESVMHCDWSLFIDDSYVDPYILQSWINQKLDVMREQSSASRKAVDRYFPQHLLEKNIPMLEKALAMNNEDSDREKEGDIHLNLGNAYFLLTNYARASYHYGRAAEIKRKFGSPLGEALFNFHRAYCLWQQGDTERAGAVMQKVIAHYESRGGSKPEDDRAGQLFILYRYMALFSRTEGRYAEALAWYDRIIRHCDRYSIEFDRARYKQEMAWCSMGIGDYGSAGKYLKDAWEMLSRYADDTKKYPVRLKFFGMGNSPVMNLGVDSLVIGESILFRELDARDKKLLNLSMQADLAERQGGLKAAARFIEEKIRLLKKGSREMDGRAMATAINNLGWNFFRRGKYADAVSLFTRARNDSLKRKNLEGMFSSTMNLANCYAHIIENKSMVLANAGAESDALAASLQSYRGEYFDARYAEEMKSLGKRAKAEGRKVKPRETAAVKEAIIREQVEKNLSIDIALATLNYYRAELLAEKEGAVGAVAERAEELYRIYSSSLDLFLSAQKTAERAGDFSLQARMLLNAALCHEKLFMHDESYESLIDAVEISERTGDRKLRFKSCIRAGLFLARAGREVEGDDFRVAAWEYLRTALDLAAETPIAFAGYASEIQSAFETCAGLMLEAGDPRGALAVSDYGGMILGALRYQELEPVLPAGEAGMYREYALAQASVLDAESSLAALARRGEEPESDVYRKALLGRDQAGKRLAALRARLSGLRRPPYVVPAGASLPEYKDISVSQIMFFRDRYYLVTLFRGRVAMEKLTMETGGAVIGYPDGAGKRYLLLNAPVCALIEKRSQGSVSALPAMLVPSIDRIGLIKTMGDISLREPLALGPDHGIFGDQPSGDESMLQYPAVITRTGRAAAVAGALYESKHFRPECLVASVKKYSPDDIAALFDAALYCGVPCVALVSGADDKTAAGIFGQIRENGPAAAVTSSSSGIFFSGTLVSARHEAPGQQVPLREIRLRMDAEALAGRPDEALAVFMRYKRGLSASGGAQLAYEEARAFLLCSRPAPALEAVDSGLALAAAGDDGYRRLVSMKAYLLLAAGDCARAAEFISSHENDLSGTADREFYSMISALCAQDGFERGRVLPGEKEEYLVERGRLRLLAAEYLSAFGMKREAAGLAAGIAGIPLGLREAVKLHYLSGERAQESMSLPEGLSFLCRGVVSDRWALEARDAIVGLETAEARASCLLCALDLPGRILSARQARELIDKEVLDSVVSGSWLDLAQLVADAVPRTGGDGWAAGAVMDEWCARVMPKIHVPALRSRAIFSQSLSLLRAGYPDRALARAGEGAPGSISGPDYYRYGLLLADIESAQGKTDSSNERAMRLETAKLDDADRYWLLMIEIRNELARLSKLTAAGPSQGELFERLFSSARSMLDRDPGVYAGNRLYGYTESMFDQYIRFKMKTGNHGRALAVFLCKTRLPWGASGAGIAGFDEDRAVDEIAGRLKPGELFVCAAGNGDDVFLWMMSPDARKASVIEGGFRRAQDILTAYGERLKSQRDTHEISSLMEDLFPDMIAAGGSGIVYVLADRGLAALPFEISGKKKMLCTARPVVFLLSTDGFAGGRGRTAAIRMKRVADDVSGGVEAAALRASGSTISVACDEKADCLHLLGLLGGDRIEELGAGLAGELCLKGGPYRSVWVGAQASSGDRELAALVSSIADNAPVIVGASFEKDINSAFYAERYYSGLRKGLTVIDAHARALEELAGRDGFRHPAYWQGIRLYLPGFTRQ